MLMQTAENPIHCKMATVPREVTPTNDASPNDASPVLVPSNTVSRNSVGADTGITAVLMSEPEDLRYCGAASSREAIIGCNLLWYVCGECGEGYGLIYCF